MEARSGPWFAVGVGVLLAGAAWAMHGFQRVHSLDPVASVVLAVGWVGILAVASVGLGWPVVRWGTARAARTAEDWVLVLVAGAGSLIAAAWALSLLGLLRPAPLLLTLAVASVMGVVWIIRVREWPSVSLPPAAVGVVAAVVGTGALLTACTLSPFYDQWHQHLGFPYQWLRSGGLEVVPRNYYSYMPGNMSFFFTYALAGLGAWSAQLVHWWMGCLAVAGVACIGNRLGGRDAALWSALLLLTCPTVMALSTTAGTDLGIAAFAAAAWLLVLRCSDADKDTSPRSWWLAGGMVGLAVGCKYVALSSVALPVGVAVIVLAAARLWRGQRSWLRVGGEVLGFAVAAVVVFSPWAVRNLVDTGSPLFPFFTGALAPLDGTAPGSGAAVARYLSAFDPSPGHLVAGLNLGTFSSQGDGFPTIGPLIAALLPVAAVLLVKQRGSARLAVAAGAVAGVLLWLPAMHICRYLVGVLVPMVAVLGDSFAHLFALVTRRTRTAVLGLVACLIVWGASSALSPIGMQRFACTLGQGEVDSIMSRWVTYWPAIPVVNEELPEHARILMVAESRGLWLDRDLVLEHPLLEPSLVELARRSPSAASMAAALAADGVTHVLFNRHEAVRIARMNQREDYFEVADAAARRRLQEFLTSWLRPVRGDAGVAVYELLEERPAEPS